MLVMSAPAQRLDFVACFGGELATARPSRPSGISVATLLLEMASGATGGGAAGGHRSDPVAGGDAAAGTGRSGSAAERLRFRVFISSSVSGVHAEIEEWHELSRGEQWRSLYMRFQDRFGIDMRYLWLCINGNLSLVMQPDGEVHSLRDGEWFELYFVPSPPLSSSGSVSEESDMDDGV